MNVHTTILNANQPPPPRQKLGIIACGALAREIEHIVKANKLNHVLVKYLPAKLHNTPLEIPDAVENALSAIADQCTTLLVGYGDCGTAGKLDKILEKYGATRLQGSHCYEFFARSSIFEKLHDAEPGTFYLTDYLTRQFDTLVYKPLGLDRHPQLRDAYFSNYTRLLYLAQSKDPKLDQKAQDAAKRLGLRYERLQTGFGALEPAILSCASRCTKVLS